MLKTQHNNYNRIMGFFTRSVFLLSLFFHLLFFANSVTDVEYNNLTPPQEAISGAENIIVSSGTTIIVSNENLNKHSHLGKKNNVEKGAIYISGGAIVVQGNLHSNLSVVQVDNSKKRLSENQSQPLLAKTTPKTVAPKQEIIETNQFSPTNSPNSFATTTLVMRAMVSNTNVTIVALQANQYSENKNISYLVRNSFSYNSPFIFSISTGGQYFVRPPTIS
jgi:hypothetical protein